MKNVLIGLNELKVGEKAVLLKILNTGPMRQRLQDMGFNENTLIECVGRSPGGDPAAYLVKSSVYALRDEDSRLLMAERKKEDGAWG